MSKQISIAFDVTTAAAPLFSHYQGEINPQDAYVELDLETGKVDASANGEIGNAVLKPVWCGRIRRYEIRNDLTGDQVAEVLEEIKPLLQRVLDGSEIVWNGNDWVGQLDADARAAEEELQRNILGHDLDALVITNLAEWLAQGDDDSWLPGDDDDVDGYIRDFDLDGHVAAEDVGEVLAEMWANRLYDGDPLPENVARWLIKDGRCADSNWVTELKLFAGYKPVLNAESRDHLDNFVRTHAKTPEDHVMSVWYDEATDVLLKGGESALLEMRGYQSRDGNPHIITFGADDFDLIDPQPAAH